MPDSAAIRAPNRSLRATNQEIPAPKSRNVPGSGMTPPPGGARPQRARVLVAVVFTKNQ